MVIYPDKVAMIMASTETVFGLGYTLGPAIGTALYAAGGFGLPFWIIGSIGLVNAILLFFYLPIVRSKGRDGTDGSKTLTAMNVLKV